MSPGAPALSVLLPVHNGMPHLAHAVGSVLQQSFEDFELLICDDGSTDGTAAYLASLDDPRVALLSQPNAGLVATLNRLVAEARAPLIARMDADDVSHSDRFLRQREYLNRWTGVVGVSSCYRLVDDDGALVGVEHLPTGDAYPPRALLLRNSFAHGGMMARRSAVLAAGGYRTDVGPVEDYDLWCRLAQQGRMANLPDLLYDYRLTTTGITQRAKQEQREAADAVAAAFRESGPWPPVTIPRLVAQGDAYVHRSRDEVCPAAAQRYASDHAELALLALSSNRWSDALRYGVAVVLFILVHPGGAPGLRPWWRRLRASKGRRAVRAES